MAHNGAASACDEMGAVTVTEGSPWHHRTALRKPSDVAGASSGHLVPSHTAPLRQPRLHRQRLHSIAQAGAAPVPQLLQRPQLRASGVAGGIRGAVMLARRLQGTAESCAHVRTIAPRPLQMVEELGRQRSDLLWLAIVGITHQYLSEHIDGAFYRDIVALLRLTVLRLHGDRCGVLRPCTISCVRVMRLLVLSRESNSTRVVVASRVRLRALVQLLHDVWFGTLARSLYQCRGCTARVVGTVQPACVARLPAVLHAASRATHRREEAAAARPPIPGMSMQVEYASSTGEPPSPLHVTMRPGPGTGVLQCGMRRATRVYQRVRGAAFPGPPMVERVRGDVLQVRAALHSLWTPLSHLQCPHGPMCAASTWRRA